MTIPRFTGFDLYSCNNVRDCFAELYKEEVFVTDKTGVRTLEILNCQFVAGEASIFGKIDDAYLKKEVDWYDTQEQNINAMAPPIPALWGSTAGENGETNSNYGWCVHSAQNHYQFKNVLEKLKKNPYSRRAIIIYTRPSMHWEFEEAGKNDFICTNTVQYFIRHNRLETIVNMRSNDAVFGYKCDRHWQMLVRDNLFSELKKVYPHISRGSIVWNAGSFHIYERHFYLVWSWINYRKHDVSMKEHGEQKREYDRQKASSKQMGQEIPGGS
jgi:thymidylate synthase